MLGVLLFMDFLANPQIQIFLQLILASILGGIIGFERECRKRAAGLKTHSLVCLGATLFTIIAYESFSFLAGKTGISFDPSRIIAGIVMGVGFIGAGLIMRHQFRVEGLTTAAGVWIVAAIGITIGIKMYLLAVFAAFLTLGILVVFGLFEEKYFKKTENEEQ